MPLFNKEIWVSDYRSPRYLGRLVEGKLTFKLCRSVIEIKGLFSERMVGQRPIHMNGALAFLQRHTTLRRK
jgi:hypothetical protein